MEWAIQTAKKKKLCVKGGSRSIIESINRFNDVSMNGVIELSGKYHETDVWLDSKLSMVFKVLDGHQDYVRDKGFNFATGGELKIREEDDTQNSKKTSIPQVRSDLDKITQIRPTHKFAESKVVSKESGHNQDLDNSVVRTDFSVKASETSFNEMKKSFNDYVSPIKTTKHISSVSKDQTSIVEEYSTTNDESKKLKEHTIIPDATAEHPAYVNTVVESKNLTSEQDRPNKVIEKSFDMSINNRVLSEHLPIEKKPVDKVKRNTNLFVPLPEKTDFMVQTANSFRGDYTNNSFTFNKSITGLGNQTVIKFNDAILPVVEENKLQDDKSNVLEPLQDKEEQTESLDLKSASPLEKLSAGKLDHTATHKVLKRERSPLNNPKQNVFERLTALSTRSFESKLKKPTLPKLASERINETPAKSFKTFNKSLTPGRASYLRSQSSFMGTPLRAKQNDHSQTSIKKPKHDRLAKDANTLYPKILEKGPDTPSRNILSSGSKKSTSPIFQKKLIKQESTTSSSSRKLNMQSQPVLDNIEDVKTGTKSTGTDSLTRFQLRQSVTQSNLLSIPDKNHLKQKLTKRLSDVMKTQQLQSERRRLEQQKRKSQLEEDMVRKRTRAIRDSFSRINRAAVHPEETKNTILHDINTKDYRQTVGIDYEQQNSAADNTLPDIDSDSDYDNDTNILASWAQEPYLSEQLSKQQAVDPYQIFGRLPPLRLDDIFQTSRLSKFKNRPSLAK